MKQRKIPGFIEIVLKQYDNAKVMLEKLFSILTNEAQYKDRPLANRLGLSCEARRFKRSMDFLTKDD